MHARREWQRRTRPRSCRLFAGASGGSLGASGDWWLCALPQIASACIEGMSCPSFSSEAVCSLRWAACRVLLPPRVY